jgi:hypothetical protein
MHAMKAYKGRRNIAPHILNPGILEQAGTDWIGDWVGSRTGLDILQNI